MVVKERAQAQKERRQLVPPVDIYDTDDAVVILADLPGVRPENLDIHVERGNLTIVGRQEDLLAEGEIVLQEFEPGEFYRSFTLGEDIDGARITAEFKDGVLQLTLPKAAERKARKITVKRG